MKKPQKTPIKPARRSTMSKPAAIIVYVHTVTGHTGFGIVDQAFYDANLIGVLLELGIGVIITQLADVGYKLEIAVDEYNSRIYVFYPVV